MAYPRYRRARAHKIASRATNLVVNSTTFVAVDATQDLVLPAQVGDTIEVQALGLWNNEAVNGRLDIATIVGGSIVNYFTDSVNGNGAWLGASGVYGSVSGGAIYTVQAADVVGGTVTLRLVARTDTATNKTLNAPIKWWAKNLGPVAPVPPPTVSLVGTTYDATSASTKTLATPVGTQPGDLLLAFSASRIGYDHWNPPAGLTWHTIWAGHNEGPNYVNDGGGLGVYLKWAIVDATNAASYTWVHTNGGSPIDVSGLITLRGINPSSPIRTVTYNNNSTSTPPHTGHTGTAAVQKGDGLLTVFWRARAYETYTLSPTTIPGTKILDQFAGVGTVYAQTWFEQQLAVATVAERTMAVATNEVSDPQHAGLIVIAHA